MALMMENGVETDEDMCATVMARFRNSQQPEHKHLCAVVTAMAEVLREQSLTPSPTAYFAAAMSSLDRQTKSPSRNEAVTTALCTFLALALPKTPASVRRSKSDAILKLLVKLLTTEEANAATVKAGLSCVENVLVAADKSNWLALAPSFNLLLHHCLDARPKVRKRAQGCIVEVLTNLHGTYALTTASDSVVSLFERSLATVSKSLSGGKSEMAQSSNTTGAVEVLHMIGALKQLLPHLSAKAIGRILPHLGMLHELQQPLLTRTVLDTLQALCMSPSADIPAASLGEILGRLGSLLSSGERRNSVDEVTVISHVIQHGFDRLHDADHHLCVTKLPAVFHSLAGLLASEQEGIVYAAGDCMRSLVASCIDEPMIKQGVSQLQSQGTQRKGALTAIERICVTCESTLSYQYSTAWDMALHIITALFDKLGRDSAVLMVGTVKTLGDLQNLSDNDMPYRKQLHKAVGAAVAAMGPDQLLVLLPLELDGADLLKSRVWLLPILKQHIVGARLQFFSSTLLPLAARLRERARKCAADGKPIAMKNAESCVQSIWALLPSVCNYPVDTAQGFGLIAKALGDALNKEPELRGLICSSLQTLVWQNQEARGDHLEGKKWAKTRPGESSEEVSASEERAHALYTPETATANLKAIAGYSRNFLPLLFNLFVASAAEKRGDLQATIGAIASISDKQTVKSFFVAIMKKLLQATMEAATSATPVEGGGQMEVDAPKPEESATSRRCVFMDLALSLVEGLDSEALGMLFTTTKPALQDNDGAVQKKAYKVLASICQGNIGFMSLKSEEILETLLTSLSSVHSSARRHRLICLHHLILHLSKSGDGRKDEAIATLISEIILATKETNKKTRNAAYDLLISIGHGMEDPENGGSRERLLQFFSMIVGCLAGSTPHMVSAAVVGLARLLYEFSAELGHTIPDLLPSALLLLRTKSREIIKSVLGLIKVVIARLPAVELDQHLRSLVEGLILWSDDSKNHFKAKVRAIIERLVRRCGMEAVSAVMPQEHMKLLTNIQKTKKQTEKKKKSVNAMEEETDNKSVHSKASTAKRSKWNHTDVFSDDNEEDDSDDDMYESTKATSMTKASLASKYQGTTKSKILRKSNKRLPEDAMDTGGGEPLDLLDTQRTREVLRGPKSQLTKNDVDDEVEFTADGKLIVDESGDRIREKLKRKKQWEEDHPDTESQGGESLKRRRAGDKSVSGKARSTREQAGSRAGTLQKPKKAPSSSWAYTGSEYANQKSKVGGDVKKEGKLDPYAYWPLDPKMLNRREAKRTAARKGMVSVIKSTKKLQGMSASRALAPGGPIRKNKQQKAHKGKSKGKDKA